MNSIGDEIYFVTCKQNFTPKRKILLFSLRAFFLSSRPQGFPRGPRLWDVIFQFSFDHELRFWLSFVILERKSMPLLDFQNFPRVLRCPCKPNFTAPRLWFFNRLSERAFLHFSESTIPVWCFFESLFKEGQKNIQPAQNYLGEHFVVFLSVIYRFAWFFVMLCYAVNRNRGAVNYGLLGVGRNSSERKGFSVW